MGLRSTTSVTEDTKVSVVGNSKVHIKHTFTSPTEKVGETQETIVSHGFVVRTTETWSGTTDTFVDELKTDIKRNNVPVSGFWSDI